MRDVRFIEAVTEKLIRARREDGSLPPDIVRSFTDHTDKELTALRNLYRIRSKGDNLLLRVQAAAQEAGDEDLRLLTERLSFLARNDAELTSGLKGAIHCFQFALNNKPAT